MQEKTTIVEEEKMSNTKVFSEPIVTESSFPKPTTRLQSLMRKYRKDQSLPEENQDSTTGSNPLANVRVKNTVSTRTFDELTEGKQKVVLSRISEVDYMKATDIQTFASAKESPMTKNAEIIISKYTAEDAGNVAEPLTNLVATLKTGNPQEIVKKFSDEKDWGIFDSLREMLSLKKARKKMAIALAEHQSIMKNIQAVSVELERQKIDLQEDIKIYEKMGKATYVQIEDFELYCIALNLMIEDAKEKLQVYLDKGKKEDLYLNELDEANNLRNAIERMERKRYSIQTVRVSTLQTVPQLAILIRGNEIICEKIDEVQTLVIPMWTWQYAIAVAAIKQREALSIQKTIRGITSKLLTGNAQLLHDNMIAAQEELYAAAVAIEDLQTVQNYIDDMVTKVNEVRKQSSQKYTEGLKRMEEIEQKNYKLIGSSLD